MSEDSMDDTMHDAAPQNGEDLDETWRVARTVGTEEEARVVVGFLESAGIPAEVESLYSSELPVDVGDLSEVRIRVPVERADEAIALLAAQDEAAPIFEDGEMVSESAEVAPSAEIAPSTETK